ncbi:MAG: VOC family protein, partial [Bacteroidia bacterium]|nr:VOC family protein [Bacteroidia bacterium]
TTGCAIVKGKDYTPGVNGPVIYLNADPDLTTVQNKIEAAGGKIIQIKKLISKEHGYMALFNDTEGNRLALWSNK